MRVLFVWLSYVLKRFVKMRACVLPSPLTGPVGSLRILDSRIFT
jgi:hypothetical protein